MVSVIIISFNTRELTQNCLASLRDKYSEAHVVVVDNASKDGSAEMIHDEFPEVELVAVERNLGFGGANNPGYERCPDSDYVILLNSDTNCSSTGKTRTFRAVSSRLAGNCESSRTPAFSITAEPAAADRTRAADRTFTPGTRTAGITGSAHAARFGNTRRSA
jgi:hypothetical protein